MTTKDILIAARAKIEDPANWIQNHLAADAEGSACPSSHPQASNIHWAGLAGDDPLACKWCALGAVQSITTHKGVFLRAKEALNRAARNLHGIYDIVEVNDDIGHAEVLACFDKAIGEQT